MIEYMVKKAIELGIIKSEDFDLYNYAFALLFSSLITWGTILLIGMIFRRFVGCLCFVLFFVPLRQYAGGVHIKTRIGCYIVSVVLLFLLIVASTLLITLNLINIQLLLLPVSLLIVFTLAPQEDINKPVSNNEYSYCRKVSRIIILSEVFLNYTMYLLGVNTTVLFFFLSATNIASMMVFLKKLLSYHNAII